MDTDYPGDPLTPGVGATPHAKRLAVKDAKTITKIPVLPISYADALPLLSALAGPVAPPEWRGALPITYHVGPGPAVVHLRMSSNWDIKPIYDVIAILHGAKDADQWVLRGNHHDAWVNGAEDPIAGQAAMLEEARMLGELHAQGWRPARTIFYCAWDGEEPGLLGSVEWVETHLDRATEARSRLHQLRYQQARLHPARAVRRICEIHQRRGTLRRRSRNPNDGVSALALVQPLDGEKRRGACRSPQAQRSRSRRRSATDPITRPFRTMPEFPL